jgi:hypothetical protein
MSSLAAWPVSSFSLLSSSTFATVVVNPKPKFVAGVVTHPCTRAVTSTVTYCPAAVAGKLLTIGPRVGAVA